MIHYESIDQSLFPEGTDISEQERLFDEFAHSSKAISAPHVFLRTCNRTEIYYGDGGITHEAANHLFRIVAGLESAIIGERAVQGQVKNAYTEAKAHRWLPAEMHKLFQTALAVGKRVRTETEISHGAVSHSLATLEIIADENVSLTDARITIIGVNKLTADILKFLRNKGAKMVCLANRSQIKAHYVADPLGIEVRTLADKKAFLADTDILISATSAPHLIVNRKDLPEDKRMLAIDLAFPRDIDSSIADMPNVRLYNIRDVERKVRANLDVRETEVKVAEIIIEEEIEKMQEALERRKRFIG